MIIVAFAIVGLIAFVGLVVDTGLVFIGYGRLRRSVDAAALAAAAQYRKDPNPTGLSKAAVEFLVLNDINDPTATVHVCNPNYPSFDDPSLCTSPARRRLVRVDATNTVNLTFLPVIGINSVTLQATATSEAASLDIVLVLDTSESMTWDSPPDDLMRDPAQCNAVRTASGLTSCQPFQSIQAAAVQFIKNLFPSDGSNEYDRVAVMTFARNVPGDAAAYNAPLHLGDGSGLTPTQYRTKMINTIEDLNVFSASGSAPGGNPSTDGSCLDASGNINWPPQAPCRYYPPNEDYNCFDQITFVPLDVDLTPLSASSAGVDPLCFTHTFDNLADGYVGPYTDAGGLHYERAFINFACDQTDPDWVKTCGTSNIGGAFRAAGEEFVRQPGFRQESLWILILLTDGVANHSDDNIYCPTGETANRHWCQDDPVTSRHCLPSGDPLYDKNAYLYTTCTGAGGTVDSSLFDADDYARAMVDFAALGQQALIFTIGYDDSGLLGRNDPGQNWGEALLNYAADMGDNGKIDYSCTPPYVLTPCNPDYFYTDNSSTLDLIFQSISDRIATRLTH